MPGPVPVYSLPWLPGIRSSTSTLLSLEFEAFQVIFLLLLIMHLALARIGYTLHLKKKKNPGASLVAQWLGIRLPMQGTRVRAPVWEDPTCRGATKLVRHNY